jgi:hypothetical protein
LMAAVSHGWKKPGGGGPTEEVATEFNKEDEGGTLLRQAMAVKLRGKKGTKPR